MQPLTYLVASSVDGFIAHHGESHARFSQDLRQRLVDALPGRIPLSY